MLTKITVSCNAFRIEFRTYLGIEKNDIYAVLSSLIWINAYLSLSLSLQKYNCANLTFWLCAVSNAHVSLALFETMYCDISNS